MSAIEFIKSLCSTKDVLSRTDHAVCKALICNMSVEERASLLKSVSLDWYLQNLVEKGEEESQTLPPERNKPWRIYLKQMKQRMPRKVQLARAHLRRVFHYLDWTAQLELLDYFLHSGLKIDRIWALRIIAEDFGIISEYKGKRKAKLMDAILRLWLKYHDEVAARIIVKHFSLDMVELFAEHLMNDCGYLLLALRLGTDPEYEIDAQRLTAKDYLYVLAKLQRPVSDEEADSLFYQSLLIALSESNGQLPSHVFSLMDIDAVSLGVWCLGKLGKNDAIMEFYTHNRHFESAAVQECGCEQKSIEFWDWAKSKLSTFFPGLHRVKQDALEEMMKQNPGLFELIKKYQLYVI